MSYAEVLVALHADHDRLVTAVDGLSDDQARSQSYDDTDAGATLMLPSEAFVRLVYGRLDDDHTPSSVTATGIELDDLRAVFPGI